MEIKRHVSYSVCEVPAYGNSERLGMTCYDVDVKELAAVELDTREKN